MSSQDFLNLSLGIGFIIIALFLSYALFSFAKTMQEIRRTLIKIELVRDGIKIGILSILKRILEGW